MASVFQLSHCTSEDTDETSSVFVSLSPLNQDRIAIKPAQQDKATRLVRIITQAADTCAVKWRKRGASRGNLLKMINLDGVKQSPPCEIAMKRWRISKRHPSSSRLILESQEPQAKHTIPPPIESNSSSSCTASSGKSDTPLLQSSRLNTNTKIKVQVG